MSGIAKLSEKMKKKISFGDYTLSTESPKIQEEEKVKPEARKSYILAKDDLLILQEIFSKRLRTENPTSISELMSEAIQLLYAQEKIN